MTLVSQLSDAIFKPSTFNFSACKQWSNMSTAPVDLKRFGHSVHVIGQKLYALGGFNGKMKSDVWTLSPGTFNLKQLKCSSLLF